MHFQCKYQVNLQTGVRTSSSVWYLLFYTPLREECSTSQNRQVHQGRRQN